MRGARSVYVYPLPTPSWIRVGQKRPAMVGREDQVAKSGVPSGAIESGSPGHEYGAAAYSSWQRSQIGGEKLMSSGPPAVKSDLSPSASFAACSSVSGKYMTLTQT